MATHQLSLVDRIEKVLAPARVLTVAEIIGAMRGRYPYMRFSPPRVSEALRHSRRFEAVDDAQRKREQLPAIWRLDPNRPAEPDPSAPVPVPNRGKREAKKPTVAAGSPKRNDVVGALRAALANGPLSTRDLRRLTGINRDSLAHSLQQNPKFFERANPDVPSTKRNPALWQLRSADPTTIPTCRHCKTGTINRPRGLCWSCYYTPGVKDRYPSTSKYARRGVGNLGGSKRPLPPLPTLEPPGTEGKLQVLEDRARDGFQLWHPFDASCPGDVRTLEYLKEHEGKCAA